jgi:hypothetical protein
VIRDPELQGPDEPLPEDDDEFDDPTGEEELEEVDELEDDDDEVDACPFCGDEDCDGECEDQD